MNPRNAEKLKFELLETWNTFNHYMTEALTFRNSEDVHQARVHLRKLLTFMQLYETKPATYRQLKQLMEALGAVRDDDVLLAQIDVTDALDEAFVRHVEAERAIARTVLVSRVGSRMTPSLDQQVRRFIGGQLYRALKKYEADPFLEKAKGDRKERIRLYRAQTTFHDRLDALHKVRLAVKRERYLHEYLANYETSISKESIQKLKRMQTMLGDMNDEHQQLLRWEAFSPPQALHTPYEKRLTILRQRLAQAVDAVTF